MPISWGKVDPSLLEPGFRTDVEVVLKDSPYGWEVRFGYRSLEEQDALYQKYLATGENRAAPPGQSAHNYGLAVDVVLDGDPRPGVQADWDTAHQGWHWLVEAVGKHPRLHSGASYADYGHIEKLHWHALKGWKVW